MAYDFIPKNSEQIAKDSSFKSNDYLKIYSYLFKKFKRNDPIALSKVPSEMRNVKITRGFQGVISLEQIREALDLEDVKISFGEGSRGGRGTANRGGQFERDLTEDLKTWWNDSGKYKNKFTEKIIDEMAKEYKWDKAKKLEVKQEGELNQKRPLIYQGKDVYIGTTGDQNIGKTVTDITVTADGKPVYLSLKATGTVTFFNAGVARVFVADEMKRLGTVKSAEGLSLLKILGINPVKFCAVFNSYGGKQVRIQEDVTRKIDRERMVKLLMSGIGYGYHYVHAKRPNEIHHFKMTRSKMMKLANPQKAMLYYGGKTSAGKRVDIEVDTPMITLKFNIRNKQGGIYPSHIMCDYVFKSYK